MKTIREWFNELPEPYRSQALENLYPENANDIKGTPGQALQYGFDWESSPQRGDYWVKFSNQYGCLLPEPESFTLSDLISFGNFSLSDKRGIDDKFVGDWDIDNWKNASK